MPYDGQPTDLPLTPEARERFIEFYNAHAQKEAEANSDALAAALAKIEGYTARLALVVMHARPAA
ncbi:MAG: DUF3987 domain-containing protein [Acidobacteriota bacterium]